MTVRTATPALMRTKDGAIATAALAAIAVYIALRVGPWSHSTWSAIDVLAVLNALRAGIAPRLLSDYDGSASPMTETGRGL